MSLAEQMPLADVKNRLSEVVERVEREHGRIIITKYGRPAAVVISVEDLESLEETLDVLDNDVLLNDVREALDHSRTAPSQRLTKEQALTLLPDR